MFRPLWNRPSHWYSSVFKKTKTHRKKTTFKPQTELLEDRSLPSAVPLNLTPDHFYGLDGNLDDQFGGPSLQANGGILDTDRYTFSNNQGLQLTNALADPGSYTIVMSFEIDAQGGFYRKLIDFQELTSDNGLYLAGSQLQFFPEHSGSSVVPTDTDFQLILSRDGLTGDVSLYFDGNLEATYSGTAFSAAFAANNVLTFFQDDQVTNGFETVSGSVDYVAIYNQALTPTEIGEQGNQAPTIASSQVSVTVAEGQTATNTGTWNDPDGDVVSLTASVGAVQQNADGTWSWSLNTTDGPDESQTVVITAMDSAGNSSFTTFDLTVNNVAPSVGIGTTLAPDHFYDLNGTLTDDMGGPSLVSDGGTLGADGYFFSNNQGLRLTNALSDPGTYTIAMTLTLDTLSPFFKKLIDFQGQSSDDGLYLAGDRLQLFPGGSGPDAVTAGTSFQVVLTRDAQSGETRVYLNGTLQQVYTGSASDGAVAAGNLLTFFEDDSVTNFTETASGFVDHIAVYNRALNPDEVANLDLPPIDSGGSSEITVDEGETATNSGFWQDPGNDDVIVSASVGTVTTNSDGTWDWSFDTTNGPTESQTVVITATDSDGSFSTTTFELIVNNVAPVITDLAADHAALSSASSDGNVTIEGTFTDPGTGDSHFVTIDWGDGTVETLPAEAVGNGHFRGSHHYSTGGIFHVQVTLTDSDGAQAVQTTKAVVQGIGLVDGTLYVIGTDGRDFVRIKQVHRHRMKHAPRLKVVLKSFHNGRSKTVKTFDPSEVDNIVVFTGAGNDRVRIHRRVRINAIVMGGAGNDFLKGGGGHNVLVGGEGHDFLWGGPKADILIGGNGHDILFDRRGDNLMIGDHAANEDNLLALQAGLESWLAGDAAATEAALGAITDDMARDFIWNGGC